MTSTGRNVNVVCVSVKDLLRSAAMEEAKRLDRWNPNSSTEDNDGEEESVNKTNNVKSRKPPGRENNVNSHGTTTNQPHYTPHPKARRSNAKDEKFWSTSKVEGRIPHVSPTDPSVLNATLRDPEPTLIRASQSVEGRSVNAWEDQPTSDFVAVPPSDPRRRSKRLSLVDMEVYKRKARSPSTASIHQDDDFDDDEDEPLDVEALMGPSLSTFKAKLVSTQSHDSPLFDRRKSSCMSCDTAGPPCDERSTTAAPAEMDPTPPTESVKKMLDQLETYKSTLEAKLSKDSTRRLSPFGSPPPPSLPEEKGSTLAADLLKTKLAPAPIQREEKSQWGTTVTAPPKPRRNFAAILREKTEASRDTRPLGPSDSSSRRLVLRNQPVGQREVGRRLVPVNFMRQEETAVVTRRPKKR